MHSKKIKQIKSWITENFDILQKLQLQGGNMQNDQKANLQPPPQTLLLLTGPPGSAKSTVIRVVAKSLGFSVLSWYACLHLSFFFKSVCPPASKRNIRLAGPKQLASKVIALLTAVLLT